MVSRIYVEKKPGFDVEAKQLLAELHIAVPEGLSPDANLRLINQYDVEGIDEALFDQTVPTVFSEPQVDNATRTLPVSGAQLATETAQELARQGKPTTGIVALPENVRVFAVEALPGQFDQRADSASRVRSAHQPRRASRRRFHQDLRASRATCTDQDVWKISSTTSSTRSRRVRQASQPRETLKIAQPTPQPVEIVEGFTKLSTDELAQFIADRGLAMDLADIALCQRVFRRRAARPHHHRDQDDRHLLVGPLPPHHVRHRARPTCRSMTKWCRAAFDQYLEHAPRAGPRRETRLPHGHGHHRRAAT